MIKFMFCSLYFRRTQKSVSILYLIQCFPAGGGFRGGRGGGGGGRGWQDQGPPERVIPLGTFKYTAQDDLVCKVTYK